MLLSDVEDQIKELFTGNEIIALTNDFANSIGEHVTFQSVNFNSKKDILSRNISDFSEDAKIQFFREIESVRRVQEDPELVEQINELINAKDSRANEARNSFTELLSKYPEKVAITWKNAVNFYDRQDYRNSLDSMRLTLELLLKEVLKNEKSLENQKQPLGSFLKERNVSTQFRNLFIHSLEIYEKIQNDEAKHDVPDDLGMPEIKFLMNQSVIIIRFIDEINDEV